MAISYVGGQTASITASTATNTNINYSLTGGLASTPAADDFVVVAYSIGSTTTRTPAINSSFTPLTALVAADTFDANLRVAYKRMGSTPDTQVQVGPTGATTDGGFVTIHVFRNVDPTTPLDGVTPTTATAGNSGTPNPAAIVPGTANNIIYVVGANGHGTTGTMTASYTTAFLTGQNITPTNRTTMGAGYVTGQSSGVSYDPAAFTWSANINTQAWCAYTLVLRDTPAAQTLTPTLYAASDTFGAATISQTGPNQSLTATAFTEAETFGAATVSPGAVTLTATPYSPTDTFGAATITVGAVTLTASLYSNTSSFGAATVSPGAVTLTPTIYANTNSFGAAVVSQASGSQDLTPTLFADADSFGAATVTQPSADQDLTASLYVEAESFGAAVVTAGATTLVASLLANVSTFGAANIAVEPEANAELRGMVRSVDVRGSVRAVTVRGSAQAVNLRGIVTATTARGMTKPDNTLAIWKAA